MLDGLDEEEEEEEDAVEERAEEERAKRCEFHAKTEQNGWLLIKVCTKAQLRANYIYGVRKQKENSLLLASK